MKHKKPLFPTAMIAFWLVCFSSNCLVKIAERGFDFGQFLAGILR